MSDMVKYRTALWYFFKLTALLFYHVWHESGKTPTLIKSQKLANVKIVLLEKFLTLTRKYAKLAILKKSQEVGSVNPAQLEKCLMPLDNHVLIQ